MTETQLQKTTKMARKRKILTNLKNKKKLNPLVINMFGYMNACQVGNILYLDTKILHTGRYYLDTKPSQI